MKNAFKIGVVILFGVSLIFIQKGREKQSDMILFNIEALGNNEASGNFECILYGSVDCPMGQVKVYKVY